MKIKHWQGYGCVNAKKISMTKEKGITRLHIRVSGNHEYGVEIRDQCTVNHWLIPHFDKTFPDYDYRRIDTMRTEMDYDSEPEACDYYIEYHD